MNETNITRTDMHYMYVHHEIASMSNTNIQIVDDRNQNNILKSGNRTPSS